MRCLALSMNAIQQYSIAMYCCLHEMLRTDLEHRETRVYREGVRPEDDISRFCLELTHLPRYLGRVYEPPSQVLEMLFVLIAQRKRSKL